MTDNLEPTHKPHEESLAFVAGQSRVSGFEFPQASEVAHGREESMMRLEESQMVSGQKDGFEPQEPDAIPLESGPAKFVIPVPDQSSGNAPSSSSYSQNAGDDLFAGVPTEEPPQQQQPAAVADAPVVDDDDPFGGDAGGADDIFGISESAPAATTTTTTTAVMMDDTSAVIPLGNGNDVDPFGGMGYDEEEKKEAVYEAETFLSVWKAKRVKSLEERAQKERNDKNESEETGRGEIQKFYEQRRARIAASRQQIQDQQETIRQELNSVFETGTIWEQVARMCDLNKTDDKVERMRNLLIELKNSS